MESTETTCSVCVTKQHEYVIYGPRCVAVRERATGRFLDDHHAIDERIALAPTRHNSDILGPWDLVLVHGFGFKIHIGPVLAVHKPDHETRAWLASEQHTGLTRFTAEIDGVRASQ